MLDAIYKLGELVIKKEQLNLLNILLPNKELDTVITVEIIQKDNQFKYNKTFQEDYDSNNYIKYLNKGGNGNGLNPSPSAQLIKDWEIKTYPKKFLKWFETHKKETELFAQLNELLTENNQLILEDIKTIYETVDKKKKILLTLCIVKDNEKFYFGDIPEFKEFIKKNYITKYSNGSKKIKGNGVCRFCNEHKTVYGNVLPALDLKFATSEKLGNTPDSILTNQWKQVPICYDCASYLSAGKNFIEKYLNFKEDGLTYYVIPNFIFESEEGFNKLYQIVTRLNNQNSTNISNLEHKLSIISKNLNDIVELKFLFYEKDKSAFNILSHVDGGIPSHISKLHNLQKELINNEKYALLHESYLNSKKINFQDDNWYKLIIKTFEFTNKEYLEIIGSILTNKNMNYSLLLTHMIDKIRDDWNNNGSFVRNDFLNAMMLIQLLNELNKEDNMDLDTHDKRCCYYAGQLSRRVINTQYGDGKNKPFKNQLYGLRLDETKIRNLIVKSIAKLDEYDRYYKDLSDEFNEDFKESLNQWDLTNDETSWYFLTGYLEPKKKESEKEN